MKGIRPIWFVIGGLSLAVGVFFSIRRYMMASFAKALIGQEEITGNTGFKSQDFERAMQEVGWSEGDQWCVYFAKLVWYQRAPQFLKDKIKRVISGSSQTTWDNVQKDPAFATSRIPKVGDMVIWQTYKAGKPEWSGHAGIVTGTNLNSFDTVEGNTNDQGGREGYIVAKKQRSFSWTTNDGLRLKGFIRFA